MWQHRMTIAWGTFLLIGGIIGGTIVYGAYYQSDYYRLKVERELTVFFGLPTDVGDIRPRHFTSRELFDTQMWLPDRRDRIFHSPRVIWDTAGTGQEDGTVLDIHDATLSVGSQAWEREDYMRVLRASLLHNFSDLDIRRVQLHNARLTWPREDFSLRATGVDGQITFDETGRGVAELTTRSFNGVTVSEPIRILARLDPHSEQDFIPEVTLDVPTLPLVVLGLDRVLQSQVTQGSFAGRIALYQSPEGDHLVLSGVAEDVRLEELTQRLPGGPLPAVVDLSIAEAVIRDRKLERIRFDGEVRALQVDALMARFGLPAIGGELDLTVYNGRVVGESIKWLGLAGRWVGGSLGELTDAVWGQRHIQGRLTVRVNVMIIENDEVDTGNIDVIAKPPAGRPGTIDRALLLDWVQSKLNLALPPQVVELLPETIEYVQLGCKLLIDSNHVRLLSVHGPAGPAILTVRVFGQDIPLLGQVDVALPIEPILEQAHRRTRQLKDIWAKRFKPQPATSPARLNSGH